jgi:hypothetical protein
MDDGDSSVGILKRRYANGEITRKQYLEMKRNLENAGGGKIGKRATPKSVPAQQHHISTLAKAIIAVIIVFIVLLIFGGGSSPTNVTTTAGVATTISAQPVSELLAAQNSTIQLTKTSSQCGPPTCVQGWFENFTVPAGATGTNLTGSYSSQYATVVAVLTPAQFTNFAHVNASSIVSNNEYYTYNKSANLNVHLAPGNYSLLFFYPGNSSDKVVITRPMALGYSAALAQSQTLMAPSITPRNSTIRPGQSVTFSSTWSGGAYHNYQAMLYSSSALPCNSKSRLIQSISNLSAGEATFSTIIPSSSAYYCIYVTSGYAIASPTTANSATSYIQVSQSASTTTTASTTTVRAATTTVSRGGGGGPSYYCGAGYVLGSYGNCYPACGGGYCTNGKVCQGGECVVTTIQSCPYGDVLSADGYCIPPCTPGSCPDGQVCQSDGECIQPGCDYGYVLGSDGHCDILCGAPGEYCIGSGLCNEDNTCSPACQPGYYAANYSEDGAECCPDGYVYVYHPYGDWQCVCPPGTEDTGSGCS